MPQFLNRDEYEATIQRELNRIHKEARATLLDLFPLDMFGASCLREQPRPHRLLGKRQVRWIPTEHRPGDRPLHQ